MKNTNEDQRSEKLSGICKFLQEIYSEFQLYGKTIKQIERKEGMGMDRWILIGIQRIKGEDNESTCTFPSEKRR